MPRLRINLRDINDIEALDELDELDDFTDTTRRSSDGREERRSPSAEKSLERRIEHRRRGKEIARHQRRLNNQSG